MPIGRLVQRFRWRRIVDKTVRYRWFPGHCKPSSRSLFVCKSPGNFLVIRVFVYVVHPAFLWVILGLACRGVCAGCIRYRFSRRPSLRPSLVFRLHASLPPSFVRWRRLFLRTRRTHLLLVRHRSSVRVAPSLFRTARSSVRAFFSSSSFRVLLLSFVFSPRRFVYAFIKHLVFRVIYGCS